MVDTHVGTKSYKSPLLWLPCELLVHTASYLSPEDLFNLRLTCRRIETFLFDTFSEEFFANRRFMVTECLKCLIDISKHPTLSKRLIKFTIGLDRLYSSDALPSVGDGGWGDNNLPTKRGVEPYRLEELAVEQNWLVSSGRLQLLLSEALNDLPNLIELNLRDASIIREFPRPESNPSFVSHGTAEVRRQTGIDLSSNESHLHQQDQFADIIFSTALLAVARSGKRLKAITVDIQKRDMGLSSSAFAIPKSLVSSLRFALQDLRSLNLSVSFTYVTLGSFATGSMAFLRWQPHYLFSFLEYTPNLTRIRIESKGPSFLSDGIIGWLARLVDLSNGKQVEGSRLHGRLQPGFDHVALGQRFHNLQVLELGNMISPTESLSKVLLHLTSSLRKLGLCMVGLSVAPGDDELDNNRRSPNAWSYIFREMSKSTCLEDIHISSLGHHTPGCTTGDNKHQVVFLKSEFGVQSGPRNGLLNTWSHVGSISVMKAFLVEVAEKTVVICSSCKQRNSSYRTSEEIL
ncbi:uncharacterized protein F4822DRAFT_443899 [Hypoxylon trugodes]|uniref:uncharacterized protein n=1 Tax=Hypoxylon trugodes TaxID=326681 RepID=UPI0021933E57|nr:uncharacterized protein F4822DRAFT_443899 [Hypoxylon trugodes]KAI1389225.1 hypothetical protein F4822DRAFT_443899 [Hypoxylon trugodes]